VCVVETLESLYAIHLTEKVVRNVKFAMAPFPRIVGLGLLSTIIVTTYFIQGEGVGFCCYSFSMSHCRTCDGLVLEGIDANAGLALPDQ
jgi:hypothetical protein